MALITDTLFKEGEKLPVFYEGKPERGTVIIAKDFIDDIHGPNGMFDDISHILAEEGLRVVRFEYVDEHTEANDVSLASRAEDIQVVKELYGSDIVIGHGLGASSAVIAGSDNLRAMILMAGVYNFDLSVVQAMAQTENRKWVRKREFQGVQITQAMFEELTSLSLEEQLRGLSCPILFIHGGKDSFSQFKQSERAYEIAREEDPGKKVRELYLIKDGNHQFRDQTTEVIQVISSYAQRMSKPL